MNQHIFSFKANSHILSLLGDELIGSDNLAIFELVLKSATPFPKCYLHKEKWTFDS